MMIKPTGRYKAPSIPYPSESLEYSDRELRTIEVCKNLSSPELIEVTQERISLMSRLEFLAIHNLSTNYHIHPSQDAGSIKIKNIYGDKTGISTYFGDKK